MRETWSGKVGFIASCVGAAIGVGNIWLFPYRLGAYGGAAFLVPYLLFVFLLGSTGLMEEFAFGRHRKKGAIGAFKEVFAERGISGGRAIGILPVLAVAGVFVFYAIVVGWILKYFVLSIGTGFSGLENIPAYFGAFVGKSPTIFWHGLAVFITIIIVSFGVKKGIERVNKIMMPALFCILIILLFRSLSLEGAEEGIKYLLIPDWSKLGKPSTWAMALGQAFFTVSLGGSAMLAYGSYLDDDYDIPSTAVQTVIFNTLASFLAAFVIIPAAFAYGLDIQSGPPLLFITMPTIFKNMMGGDIFGFLFFLSVVFAGLSSAINLLEAPVEALITELKWSRRKTVIIVGSIAFLIGIPLDINMNLFLSFINIVTVYLVPVGALLAAITFFWIFDISKARAEINKGAKRPLGEWWEPFAKYVFTGVAVIVLVLSMIFKGIG